MAKRLQPQQPVRNYIREWRAHFKLSGEALGERLGTDKGQVSRWENDKRGLDVNVAAAIAEAMGLTFFDLFRDPRVPSADAMLDGVSPEDRAGAIETLDTYLRVTAAKRRH